MGANIGAKALAVGLLALTGGDEQRALAVWDRIRDENPGDVGEAIRLVVVAVDASPD